MSLSFMIGSMTRLSSFVSLNSEFDKQQIAQQFGQAAADYHAEAHLQRQMAQQLLASLDAWPSALPEGPVLEVGCGTGFLTQGLVKRFPNRSFDITDLSRSMLQFCQATLDIPAEQRGCLQFRQVDGEAIEPLPYALIASAFAIQWFKQPVNTLRHWLNLLKPGGLLLISLPVAGSFPEWRSMCEQLNLPFTANVLPQSEEIRQSLSLNARDYVFQECDQVMTFPRSMDFFKNLKSIGAGFNSSGQHLSLSQMRQLTQYWDHQYAGSITVHCRVLWGVVQR